MINRFGLVAVLALTGGLACGPAFCADEEEVVAPRAPLSGHITVEDTNKSTIEGQSAGPAASLDAPSKPIAPRRSVSVPPSPPIHAAPVAPVAPSIVRKEEDAPVGRLPFRLRKLPPEQQAAALREYRSQLRAGAQVAQHGPLLAQSTANEDKAPYMWSQSITGGYVDTTGHVKEIVWGDKLSAYGGHFFDGTPVPKGPVTINRMGHIWWQPELSPTHFVRRETTNL